MGKIWTDILPKRYEWPISIWKDVQHHQLLGKCKLKSQSLQYLLRVSIIKKMDNTNVDKEAEKLEPSHIVGGNGKWYSHFGKHFGIFFKN